MWKRFDRWARKGVWHRVFEALKDPDLEWLILDSTVIRAHPHAAGAVKGGADQALGRSRGGFSTKLHFAVDGLGNPVVFLLTGGQVADVTQAEALIDENKVEAAPGRDTPGPSPGAEALIDENKLKAVIADKAYDSDPFGAAIEARGAAAVIPPKKNRTVKRDYDKHLYKERNLAERFINKIKQYRRVATRYEKTARNFLAFIHVASIMVLLI